MGEVRNEYKHLYSGNINGRIHLGDSVINGEILLKLACAKCG
jgi:hypothetical protein